MQLPKLLPNPSKSSIIYGGSPKIGVRLNHPFMEVFVRQVKIFTRMIPQIHGEWREWDIWWLTCCKYPESSLSWKVNLGDLSLYPLYMIMDVYIVSLFEIRDVSHSSPHCSTHSSPHVTSVSHPFPSVSHPRSVWATPARTICPIAAAGALEVATASPQAGPVESDSFN